MRVKSIFLTTLIFFCVALSAQGLTREKVKAEEQRCAELWKKNTDNAGNEVAQCYKELMAKKNSAQPKDDVFQQTTPNTAHSQRSSINSSSRSGTNCVRRDYSSNSLGDFWENHCNFPVWISWFSDDCKRGCAAGPISPGSKESTNKLIGHMEFAACEYPSTPRNRDRSQWRGVGPVFCSQ